MANNFRICPTCGGQLFLENDPETGEEFVCFQAGHRFTREQLEELMKESRKVIEQAVPPKPTTGNLWDIKRYYDQNKERILADLAELGTRAMCRMWHINSGTWAGLRKRWGILPKQPRHPKSISQKIGDDAHVTPPPPAPSEKAKPGAGAPDSGLPPGMPAFSPDWSMETQVKWLEVFRDLYKGMIPILDEYEERLEALEADREARDTAEKKAAENYKERAGL